jgi:imidazolonepropionase
LGAHDIPPEYKDDREAFVDYLIDEVMPQIAQEGSVDFCDVFCDQGVFSIDEARKILLTGQKLGLKSKLHADEIAQVGAAELAAEIEAISADHLLKASDEGIEMMAEKGVIGVLLPITAFSLKEKYAPGRKMIDKGLPVALATDLNPGSCHSESIPLLVALATLYMGLTPEEAVTALTINGAAAIDRADEIGSIEKGKKGDIVILDAPSYDHLSYHIGVNVVDKVIKAGELVVDHSK